MGGGSAFLRVQQAHPPSLRGPGLAYEKSGLLAGVTGCGLTVSRVGGRGEAGRVIRRMKHTHSPINTSEVL